MNRLSTVLTLTPMRAAWCSAMLAAFLPVVSVAQSVPAAAEAGRVDTHERLITPEDSSQKPELTVPVNPTPETVAPPGTEKLKLHLKKVHIEGVTIYSQAELYGIYDEYIDTDVTLAVAWKIADRITRKYRKDGYFLSRAFVPEQEVEDGKITIRVVEGYIDEVEYTNDFFDRRVPQQLIGDLKSERPVSSAGLESFLLRLNDLPDFAVRGVMAAHEPADGAPEGAVKLVLESTEKKGKGSLDFDNYSSRFLGPNEFSASYATSLIPTQQTSVTFLTSQPTDELKYGTLEQRIPVSSESWVTLNGSATRAHPGYSLASLNLLSNSKSLGAEFNWQPLRQRQENLTFKLGFNGQNSTNELNTSGFELSEDHIRSVKAGFSYDTADRWGGYNAAVLAVTRGIDGFGSSQEGDSFLSRSEAVPDFIKAELTATRVQRVSDRWSLFASVAGQIASDPLYSSEEFGYGGQAYGRSYDSSEIVGDQGVAGSIEFRYAANPIIPELRITPYTYVDYGVVWNIDGSQFNRASGASFGGGMRFETLHEVSGNLGVAFPIDRDIENPIYGADADGPRILLQFSKDF